MKRIFLNSIDPYRVLFPIGLVHAVVGTSVWILFALNLSTWPGQTHPHHMVDGFLLSFAAGFMMTAIPRFTGAARCSGPELLFAAALAIIALFVVHPLTTLSMLLFISTFFLRRLLTASFSPPPHFLFLAIGLLLGISGSVLLTLVEFEVIGPGYAALGRVFLYYGTMLSFLLGIGAKLISALLGWVAPPVHRIEPRIEPVNKWTIPLIQAALFLAGFAVEVFFDPATGRGLQAVCATWIAMQNWRLYRRPAAPGKLPFWIWVSAWMLLTGLWTHSLLPGAGIHAAHLIFMGGFGLMTLLVASRVTLAHGGYSLDLESKSRIFAITGTLILLAAATRFTSQWTPSLFQHYAYAAGIWIVALVFWGWFFLTKMFPGMSQLTKPGQVR